MSSLEEEKLVQMVHDFIESETTPPTSNTSSQTIPLHHSTCFTLQGIVGNLTKAEMEVYEKVLTLLKFVSKVESGRKSGCLKRELMMWLRMDGYDASLCRTSWAATLGRLGGDYEYIDIMLEDENGISVRLIVDIDFKSQFELARPTLTYTQLFNTVPCIFVGSEDKLCKTVTVLCSAAKQSLKERGLHIPPWRKASYMQSKWLSCCEKISAIDVPMSDTQANVENDEKSGENGYLFSSFSPLKPAIR